MNEQKLLKKYADGERNFSGKDLSYANLSHADLSDADLMGANLTNTDLMGASLSGVNLCGADLRHADLFYANLTNADLHNADLRDAELHNANLTNAKGLLDPIEWMDKTFQKTKEGYIVYKGIGHTEYPPNPKWIIEENSTIKETVDQDVRNDCSFGINFATKEWVEWNYPKSTIWKCLLKHEDIDKLCVPLATDGKARCGKLTLLYPC